MHEVLQTLLPAPAVVSLVTVSVMSKPGHQHGRSAVNYTTGIFMFSPIFTRTRLCVCFVLCSLISRAHWCNPHHGRGTESSHRQKELPLPPLYSRTRLAHPPLPLATANLCFVSLGLFQDCYINGIIWHVTTSDWLFSPHTK